MTEFLSGRNEDVIQQSISAWTPGRREQAIALSAQYDADDNPIDGVAAVPVDVTTETPDTLAHTLECYAGSALMSSEWQIMLFLNGSKGVDPGKVTEMTSVGQDFCGSEQLPIHTLFWEYDEPVTMGRIRSDADDQVALHPGKPWLKAGHDADLRAIHPDYFDKITEAARDDPLAMFLTSELVWDISGEHLPARVARYWVWQRQAARRPPVPTDANVVMRLDACLGLGGFDRMIDVTKMSETGELCRRAIAKFGKQIIRIVEGVPLTTNPRRVYAAVAAGRTPHEMVAAGNFGIHRDDGGVRSGEFDPASVELDPDVLVRLLDEMDQQFMGEFEAQGVSPQMRQEAREALGLPYGSVRRK